MASGRLIDYLGVGTAASRPVTPTLHTGVLGLYYASDTDVLSMWDGSTWEDVGSTAAWGSITGTLSSQTDLQAALAAKLDALYTENVQTGTSYTLALADAFKLVTMSNAAANILTVPLNSSVAFPVGTRIDLGQDGAGQTTVQATGGVTIRTPETLKLRKQWAKATLIKRATDTWDIEGNLEAAP